jgi:hypothetical protein
VQRVAQQRARHLEGGKLFPRDYTIIVRPPIRQFRIGKQPIKRHLRTIRAACPAGKASPPPCWRTRTPCAHCASTPPQVTTGKGALVGSGTGRAGTSERETAPVRFALSGPNP